VATDRDPEDLAEVAAQASWVRRLAVALAHDVHAGEDVAQDALLAAARGHGVADLRAWLAGTVRNLVRLRHRGDERRAERERRAARAERVDDPALAFERLELQEALLGAVRQLPEPYRTTVLLRWFEGLEPEEIARRTQTPVRTIHTRLHRALALLRESLARRSQGDRSRWLAAWIPLAKSQPTLLAGGIMMTLKLTFAIAGLVCAGLIGIRLASDRYAVSTPQPALASNSVREPVEVANPSPTELDGVASEADRREQAAAAGSGARESSRGEGVLHGLAVDTTGAKVPGIELVFNASGSPLGTGMSRATSDALGRFELAIGGEHGQIALGSGEWTLVYAPDVCSPVPPEGYVLVLGKPHDIGGIVVDPSGKPVPGVDVLALDALIWNEDRAALEAVPLAQGNHAPDLLGGHPSTTDAGGRFQITGLVAHSYRLLAKNNHTLERTITSPIGAGDLDAFVVLGDAGGLCSFSGRIVDLQGAPLAHATIAAMRTIARGGQNAPVCINAEELRTEEDGRFELPEKSCQLEGFIVWPDRAAPPRIVCVDPSSARSALLIRVGRIAHVQVELQTPGLVADSAEFLDSSGVVCQTGVKWKTGWAGGDSMGLTDGKSREQMVSEEAATLVLRAHGAEVKRVPIHLEPKTVNVLRP
jgi:RNA polymerase sigma factor (sigma-70 family)